MANFSTLRIKSAVKGRSKNDLSSTHLTTMDFGQIVPLWAEEALPGAEYKVSANFFSRMAPLVKPTYGKFYFKTMEVFVPYYQVCDDIDAWMAGRQNHEGDSTNSRWISRVALVSMFLNAGYGLVSEVSSDSVSAGSWYDFSCIHVDGLTTKYYVFTAKGRYFNKVLNSLGYVIPSNCNLKSDSLWYTTIGSEHISALPLIAFAKAYNDWMSQSQRFNSSVLSKLLKNIRHNVTTSVSGTTVYSASTNVIPSAGIYQILSALKLCYENDYFTSAWMQPNAPIFGETYDPQKSSTPGYIDPNPNASAEAGLIYQDGDNTMYYPYNDLSYDEEEGAIEGKITIAQRSLDILKSFDDWVRRNNYSGSRSVQQVYSRFGIKTADYKSNYAHLIDTSTMPIQVGDVTAMSQDYVGSGSAQNLELGDYAGKGIMNGQTGFTFKCNDYGLIMLLGWYTVAPMNVYGEDKKVLRNTPLDYYNPEFDGVTMEPISVGELFVNPRITTTTQSNAVFGFTEKYNSYRFGKDRITGDFRKMPLLSGTYANAGTEMNTWHTGRILNTLLNAGTLVAQNPDFSTLPQTNSEYNRIFSVTDGSVDHFYMTAQFKVSAILPILSLNQVPRLGEGNTVLPRNGNEVN